MKVISITTATTSFLTLLLLLPTAVFTAPLAVADPYPQPDADPAPSPEALSAPTYEAPPEPEAVIGPEPEQEQHPLAADQPHLPHIDTAECNIYRAAVSTLASSPDTDLDVLQEAEERRNEACD